MIRSALLFSAALVAGPAIAAPAANTPVFDSAAISGLGARNIGSAAMSGRIAALAARQEKDGKTTLFVGAASGGVWKSEDGGTSFRPVFDRQPVQSIGAVSLDPTDPKVVWVGTGESWTRNSVSVGDGVYKSTDGGESWTKMGLPGTERIARILVHPKDGNTVFVCAPGPLWSDSADRGLYKTTDGGRTWSVVLKGANLSTGCSSIAFDPANPDRMLAGLWDFRRKPWTFRSGGEGADAVSGSALHETMDGGRSWRPLTTDSAQGLPKTPWGRVEVAFAPSDPSRIYAVIENVRTALYVSSDGGRSWEERDRSRNMVWRPFYFSKLVVDPVNKDRLFKTNLRVIVSEDGGKSFADSAGGSHADWHDLWINPNNPKHIIGGDDGGLWISHDGGVKWWRGANLPISQFYHVSVDSQDPYQVYGGLQDNSSWVGDSEYPGGITNQRWENLYGGDGFWVWSDPSDPNFAYAEYQGGNISRIDRRTLQARDIQPKAGYKEKLRWNWNTPIALSPHEKGAIYIGSQYLFRTRDQGDTWQRISPDLTTNNPEKQRQEESGGITVDNSSAEMHTTIYSVSESPKVAGQIWVGTDDGNVQLTRDGGKSWTNLTRNLKAPAERWISWIEASRHDPAVAYAAVDRHMWGDLTPYLYVTRDYGRTWTQLIGARTPGVRGYAHVVKEDRERPNLLYVGTEFGLFVSINGGQSWAQFKPNNFPAVAVRDIAIPEKHDDLVLGTHGRGIWVIDDVAPLRTLTPERLASAASLVATGTAEQRIRGNGGWSEGDASYAGENPADGAVITFYQRARHVVGRMKLEVLDAQGKVVEELPASKRRGLNRVVWAMRTKPPQVPPAATVAFSATRGQRVMPGQYTVRLTKAGETMTMPLTVAPDRRATYTPADQQAQYAAADRAKAMFARLSVLNASLQSVRAGAEKAGANVSVKAEAGAVAGRAEELRRMIVATKEGGAITGEERLREHLDMAYGQITATEARPPAYAVARLDALDRELKEVEDAFAALKAGEAARLNAKLAALGAPIVDLAAVVPAAEEARGGPAAALADGLIGTRFTGDVRQLLVRSKRSLGNRG